MNWKRFGLWMIVAAVLSATTLLILTALGCERGCKLNCVSKE